MLGYLYGGTPAAVSAEPAVAPVPPEYGELVGIKRQHYTLPEPILDAAGRPTNWVGTPPIETPWGRVRVTMNGRDVTFDRNRPIVISDIQYGDPFGWLSASFVFPMRSNFEGRPSFFGTTKKPATVVVNRVNDAGEIADAKDPLFFGIVDSVDPEWVTQVDCSGWWTGHAATKLHQPDIHDPGSLDGARLLNRACGYRGWFTLYRQDTGIELRYRGSRIDSLMGYVNGLLERLIHENGKSWTLMPHPAKGKRAWKLKLREMKDTPDFTVHNGAHGVRVNGPRRDRLDNVSGIWGEGVRPDGGRWYNKKFPNQPPVYIPEFTGPYSLGDTDESTGGMISVLVDQLFGNGDLEDPTDRLLTEFTEEVEDVILRIQRKAYDNPDKHTGVVNEATWDLIFAEHGVGTFQRAYYESLSQDPTTERYLLAPDGTHLGLNPTFDKKQVPNEQFINYGAGTRKRRATKDAAGRRVRAATLNGTLTLTSDPAEMSRFRIRPGDTGRILYLDGTGSAGLDVYVSHVRINFAAPNMPVTIAWSTNPRHYIDLATIKQRRMEARQDPAADFRAQLTRKSTQTNDAMDGWEAEGLYGDTRVRALSAGWNRIPMPAGDAGSLGEIEWKTWDSPVAFYALLNMSKQPGPGKMAAKFGDPGVWHDEEDEESKFDNFSDWLRSHGFIEWWGRPNQRLGFSPRKELSDKGKATDAPVTGKGLDETQLTYTTKNGYLYWHLWVPSACKIRIRAKCILDGNN